MTGVLKSISLCLMVFFVGCRSVQTGNTPCLALYIAPYQTHYGNLLGATRDITGALQNETIPMDALRPELFGVVLVNSGDTGIQVPSYDRDPIGSISLSFEIRDGNEHVRIEKDLKSQPKTEFIKEYGHASIVNPMVGTMFTLAPKESVILVPHFGAGNWLNVDEIYARKDSDTAQIRTVFELYPWKSSREYGLPVTYYSGWIEIRRLIPFPLSKMSHAQKLVY
jgi:hypothetical protein